MPERDTPYIGSLSRRASRDDNRRGDGRRTADLYQAGAMPYSPAAPIIGTTSQVIRKSKWYKEIDKLGVSALEINRRHSKLHFSLYFLDKVKYYLQGWDLSLHSATTGVFQGTPSFTDAELAALRAELDICRFLGARELVFHLNYRRGKGRAHERLQEIIDEAKANGIQMLYESDSAAQAHIALEVLERYEDLDYVLDLGHMNNGHGRGVLGCGISEFLQQIRSRVVYLHASNNCGTMDEHKGLDLGSLDWRKVLDELDLNRVRKIIIEVRTIDYLADSLQALKAYFRDFAQLPDGRAKVAG